ncbi:MAG: hypothetical protein V7K41_09475 [Nostoc sp.]|uniref:hypothetical protein n=1 Tax=Nostoc sp. TaxID=1180 RepID=UPI002FF71241
MLLSYLIYDYKISTAIASSVRDALESTLSAIGTRIGVVLPLFWRGCQGMPGPSFLLTSITWECVLQANLTGLVTIAGFTPASQ